MLAELLSEVERRELVGKLEVVVGEGSGLGEITDEQWAADETPVERV